MLSVVIATHESERTLVPTLAALVPGATAGLISEVVIADAGSRDATAEVADIAGCRFMSSTEPLGPRLKAAALSTRTPWLMFLRAGTVPEPGWVTAVDTFMEATDQLDGASRAAVFRPAPAGDASPAWLEALRLLFSAFGGGARTGQGLLIARQFYERLGGHGSEPDPEAALLRKIGRRLTMLSVAARAPR
jgi:glycosyltransferase involved in cell wall biosynthesis